MLGSEYECEEDRELNFSQMVKAYKQGDKAFQRLLAEEAVALEVRVCRACQKGSSLQETRRVVPRRTVHTAAIHLDDLLSDGSDCSDESEEPIPVKEVVINPIRKRVSLKKEVAMVHCRSEEGSSNCCLDGATKKNVMNESEKPFKCPFEGCDYATSRSHDLKRHLRTHTGEKPFKCPFEGCDFATSRSGHLKEHMRTHTGEKPYKCPFEGCDYATSWSGNLKKHMRIHTGEKPYKCPFEGCDFATSWSKALKDHMRTHTG